MSRRADRAQGIAGVEARGRASSQWIRRSRSGYSRAGPVRQLKRSCGATSRRQAGWGNHRPVLVLCGPVLAQ